MGPVCIDPLISLYRQGLRVNKEGIEQLCKDPRYKSDRIAKLTLQFFGEKILSTNRDTLISDETTRKALENKIFIIKEVMKILQEHQKISKDARFENVLNKIAHLFKQKFISVETRAYKGMKLFFSITPMCSLVAKSFRIYGYHPYDPHQVNMKTVQDFSTKCRERENLLTKRLFDLFDPNASLQKLTIGQILELEIFYNTASPLIQSPWTREEKPYVFWDELIGDWLTSLGEDPAKSNRAQELFAYVKNHLRDSSQDNQETEISLDQVPLKVEREKLKKRDNQLQSFLVRRSIRVLFERNLKLHPPSHESRLFTELATLFSDETCRKTALFYTCYLANAKQRVLFERHKKEQMLTIDDDPTFSCLHKNLKRERSQESSWHLLSTCHTFVRWQLDTKASYESQQWLFEALFWAENSDQETFLKNWNAYPNIPLTWEEKERDIPPITSTEYSLIYEKISHMIKNIEERCHPYRHDAVIQHIGYHLCEINSRCNEGKATCRSHLDQSIYVMQTVNEKCAQEKIRDSQQIKLLCLIVQFSPLQTLLYFLGTLAIKWSEKAFFQVLRALSSKNEVSLSKIDEVFSRLEEINFVAKQDPLSRSLCAIDITLNKKRDRFHDFISKFSIDSNIGSIPDERTFFKAFNNYCIHFTELEATRIPEIEKVARHFGFSLAPNDWIEILTLPFGIGSDKSTRVPRSHLATMTLYERIAFIEQLFSYLHCNASKGIFLDLINKLSIHPEASSYLAQLQESRKIIIKEHLSKKKLPKQVFENTWGAVINTTTAVLSAYQYYRARKTDEEKADLIDFDIGNLIAWATAIPKPSVFPTSFPFAKETTNNLETKLQLCSSHHDLGKAYFYRWQEAEKHWILLVCFVDLQTLVTKTVSTTLKLPKKSCDTTTKRILEEMICQIGDEFRLDNNSSWQMQGESPATEDSGEEIRQTEEQRLLEELCQDVRSTPALAVQLLETWESDAFSQFLTQNPNTKKRWEGERRKLAFDFIQQNVSRELEECLKKISNLDNDLKQMTQTLAYELLENNPYQTFELFLRHNSQLANKWNKALDVLATKIEQLQSNDENPLAFLEETPSLRSLLEKNRATPCLQVLQEHTQKDFSQFLSKKSKLENKWSRYKKDNLSCAQKIFFSFLEAQKNQVTFSSSLLLLHRFVKDLKITLRKVNYTLSIPQMAESEESKLMREPAMQLVCQGNLYPIQKGLSLLPRKHQLAHDPAYSVTIDSATFQCLAQAAKEKKNATTTVQTSLKKKGGNSTSRASIEISLLFERVDRLVYNPEKERDELVECCENKVEMTLKKNQETFCSNQMSYDADIVGEPLQRLLFWQLALFKSQYYRGG